MNISRTTMTVAIALAWMLLLSGTPSLFAQGPDTYVDNFSDLNLWQLPASGCEKVSHKGRDALRLKPGWGERIAYLKDFEFADGTIELDIAALPFYTGLVFRVRDDHVYEGIYFRPQNSRQKDPVRRGHTVQYIANPLYTWYYLREKTPEKYEAAVDLPPSEWFHVKVEVAGTSARVFINNAVEPCMIVEGLKHGLTKGSVGLWAGNRSAGTFANLRIQKKTPSETGTYKGRVTYTEEQKYLFDIFKTRRSVRNFKPDPVPQEHIMKILDMARSGPTSGHQQPWMFLVLQDREKLDLLRDECVKAALEKRGGNALDEREKTKLKEQFMQRYTDYLSAPVYVLVLVNKKSRYPSYNRYDGSVAAGYLMIAARALGYGTVFSQDTIPYDIIQKVFSVPDQYERICFTPIGIPVEWPESPPKKDINDVVVFERLIEGVNYTVPITRKAVELDEKKRLEYPGIYMLETGIRITISMEKEKLYIQVQGQPKFEIFAEAPDAFFLKIADVQLVFERNDRKEIDRLIIIQNGQKIPAQRKMSW